MSRAGRSILSLGFALFGAFAIALPDVQPARANPGVTTLTCTPPAVDSRVSGLARALNYNFDQIYEYVYYNTEFSPVFGSAKGALGAILDKRGTNIDQNVLLVTLLRQSCITANYRYGTVTLPAATVANLFGVQNDAALLSNVLGLGNVPADVLIGGSVVTSGGPADQVRLQMMWTEATVGSTTYKVDPSLKSYARDTPIDVAAAMNYNKSAFLTAAQTGSSTLSGMPAGVDSIKSLNQANIKSQLNTYAENLGNYITANAPSSSTSQLFGGAHITNDNYGATISATGDLYTDVPAALETVFTYSISNNADGSSPSASVSFYGSQLAGKSISLTYNTGRPVISVNGSPALTGPAGGTKQTINMSVSLPNAPAAQTVHPSVTVGGVYALITSAGEVGRDTVSALQTMTAQQAKYWANPGPYEKTAIDYVLGLDTIGHSYLAQSNAASHFYGNLARLVPMRYAAMGIAGFYPYGPAYVDFPMQLDGAARATITTTADDIVGYNMASAQFESSLESTTVSQLQKTTAVSTVRMMDFNNQDGTGFIQANAGNWTSVKALLTNWDAATLTSIGTFLATSTTAQVILPKDGKRTITSSGNSWSGAGYYLLSGTSSTSLTTGYLITGGYKGGYGLGSYSFNTPSLISLASTWDMQNGKPLSWDPIDLVDGDYLYDHEDINVGSGEFPFGLALKRSYNSNDANTRTALGYGWRHNFMMSATLDSDTFEAFGLHNPLAAVPTVVAYYVNKDINTASTTSLTNVVISALSASWMMDQLVDNAVTLRINQGTKRFAKIPTASGGSRYVAPPGDGSTLVLNTDNTITLTDKSGIVSKFDANGFITSWTDTNANVVTFTYTGTGDAKLLKTVTNGMGRTLTFTYSGTSLASVSDGTRSVSYSYTAAGVHLSPTLSTFKDTKAAITTFSYSTSTSSLLTQIKFPAFSTTPAVTTVYDNWGHVLTQTDALGNVWTYLFANRFRSQEINPEGGSHVLYFDANGNQTQDIDQAGDKTMAVYDGIGRLIKTTGPLGNTTTITYDSRSNVLSRTTTPIPGAIDRVTGVAAVPVTESWTYNTTFNKPLTHTDALGRITSYAYDTAGNVTSVTQPAVAKPGVSGLVAPVTTTTYGAHGLPATVVDAEGRKTTFAYQATTFNLISTVQDAGTGRLNLTTSATYDAVGNKITATDPKGFTTTYAYDAARQVTQVTPGAPFAADITKFTYDANGNKLTAAQAITSTTWMTTTTTYNAANKPTLVTNPDGTTTTTAYDSVARVASTTSSSGRQVTYGYDLASRPIWIKDGVSGTLDSSITQNLGTVTRETRTYYPGSGGLLATLADGNGNALTYSYDGFGRNDQIAYPGSTTSVPDADVHSFDAAGRDLTFKRRDGSLITASYDALDRVVSKAPAAQPAISYGYDYTGNLLTVQAAGDASPTQISYDTAGRKIGETTPMFGTISATLDANGNRTSLDWPGASYTVSNAVDQLGRLTGVYEGTVATGTRFAGYTFNTLSQRSAASYGPAAAPVASGALTYTGAGQLASLVQTWNGSSLTLGYTYNKDHQRASLAASDATYLASSLTAGSTVYARNSLNQYTTLTGTGAATYVYDKRGNLTDDGVWTYGYDTENRLVSASKSGTGAVTATYAYDALGRRQSKTVNGVTTAWASYGNQEIAEYQNSGTGTSLALTTRYIYGAGLDEPIASVSATNVRTYQFQDALGSVIALANASGQVTEKYGYTAYGLAIITGPGTAAFRYTGRRFDAETGLYSNRARAYSPTLGRFLQTDPIGTAGGINLYAYTGNDPTNFTDPSGHGADANSIYTSGHGIWARGVLGPSVAGSNGPNCAFFCSALGGSVALNSSSGIQFGSYNHQAFNSGMQLAATAYWVQGTVATFAFGGPWESAGGSSAATNFTVFNSIKATQPVYEGTVIPKSFELATINGSVWVHGNATEHLAEWAVSHLNAGLGTNLVNLGSQMQLNSLKSAVTYSMANGVQYGRLMQIGGWELKYGLPRQAGQLPALVHAFPY